MCNLQDPIFVSDFVIFPESVAAAPEISTPETPIRAVVKLISNIRS